MFAPLYFIISYMIFVIMLAAFGPVKYVDFDALLVSFYVGLILISISIGYYLGIVKPLFQPHRHLSGKQFFPRAKFKILCSLAVLGLSLTFIAQYGSGNANFDISEIGETYVSGYKGYEQNSGNYSISFIIYSIFLLPTFVSTIWGVYFFKYLERFWQCVTLFVVVVFPLMFTLISGTQKNVGDTLIYILSIAAIKLFSNDRKISFKLIMGVVATMFGGAIALLSILSQRYSAIGINAFNIGYNETYHIYHDIDNFLFKIFDPDTALSISILSGYFTNGLNGLSYCLRLPNGWSSFMGSSYSVSVVADRVFGMDFPYKDTYPYQAGLQYGWDQTRWHTVFSWFASDFTFTGTVVIFGFLGYVYARAWAESIRFQNPYSILLFCLLSMGVIMMPANNQLMHTPGSMVTLVVTILFYLRFRLPFNRLRPTRA